MPRELFLVVLSAVLVVGCGGQSGPAKKACYPVKGQVLVQGKPAEGVLLIFRPKENPDATEWPTGFPHATSAAEGKFEIGTYTDNDGAPAGDYVVVATWTVPNPQNEEASSPDKLGGRFADPATSKLSAKVEAKPTELSPINLQ